jgi:hypothetical protein
LQPVAFDQFQEALGTRLGRGHLGSHISDHEVLRASVVCDQLAMTFITRMIFLDEVADAVFVPQNEGMLVSDADRAL